MTLVVFRRFTRTESVPVTTTVPEPRTPVEAPAATPAPLPLRLDKPPAYTPGLCWHKVHAYFDGVRYGIAPRRGDPPNGQFFQVAALTPCDHLSRTGT